MLVVAGLGNPGPRYARTRHNAGFVVVSALAEAARAAPWRDKFQGESTRCSVGSTELLLLRPMTFMNESGRSVQAALSFFRVDPADLIVIHDELDLPFGTVRLKVGGGHAGHNGLRSIFETLGTGDFIRLRMGIGRPPQGFRGDVADFVLSDLNPEEGSQFPAMVDKAVNALQDLGRRGLAAASNALNMRPKPPKPKPVDAPSERPAVAAGGPEATAKDGVAKDDD